ncbi:hypothetical protein PYCCODRAFT_1431003 [Trametes coccinea BRFM310]|uniref:Proteasome assembly chaperone 3 n=1 Tax=Trametes coccinea (strain BRFM310) TaxID=1353009 RepID=A0A1Y2J3P3_TRAC3|nr:hypothetical protein PYCCODRAFT_1431003 [Trametes coccinea BRFM310]
MAQTQQDTPAAIQPRIHVDTRYFPPAGLGLPALAVQTTRLVDTYMLWVGTTDVEPELIANAPLQGCLAKDWACAMPAREMSGTPPAATPLYRTSSSEASLSMAQRLARRFKKQIFLSIDMPPSLGSMGQEGKLLLAIERAVVETLKSHEVVVGES